MKLLVIHCLVALIYSKVSASNHRVPKVFAEGEDAVPHEFPWIVRLYGLSGGFPIADCTGSLISPNIVLTAAHCITTISTIDPIEFKYKQVKVYAGYHENPDLGHISPKGEIRYSEKFLVPPLPKRHDTYESYDLAIIILSKPINKSKTIDFIELANQNLSMVHFNSCYAAGFGSLGNLSPAKVLQKLRFKVMNRTDCQVVLEFEMPQRPTSKPMSMKVNDMICAQGTRNGSFAYHGDSGGPFMCPNDEGKWVLYGITVRMFQFSVNGPWVNIFAKIEPVKEWLVKAIRFYNKRL